MAELEHGPALEITHVFGSHCGTGFRDPVFFDDEIGHHVVHPVGRHLAFRHIDTGDTTFTVSDRCVEAITACCVSKDKSLLACCERCSKEPTARVAIYDLHEPAGTKKLLDPLGGAPGRFICAAFSSESPSRFLALVTAGTEPALLLLDWQAERVLAKYTMDKPIDRVAFAPHDVHLLSLSGPHTLRLLRVSGKMRVAAAGKGLQSFEGIDEPHMTITDHTWIDPGDGAMVACTAEGQVYIISTQDMKVVTTIDMPFQDTYGISSGVPFCVRCFSHGFILGGSAGLVSVWEQVDQLGASGQQVAGVLRLKDFRHVRTMRVMKTDASIGCIDITSNEDSLVLGFRNADIGYMTMASLYMSRGNEVDCTVFSGGFHSGAISGLDIAVHRPLVVSICRKDSSLRIWNYATKYCDLTWDFAVDTPLSVAMHPFGYLVAVGFSDKLRLFLVLVNELKLHREVQLRGAKFIRFAHGGQFLAAVQGKIVQVYTTRSMTNVATLVFHEQVVTDCTFDPQDQALWTCSEDGALCQWSTRTWERLSDHSFRSAVGGYVSCSAVDDVHCSYTEGSRCFVQRFRAGSAFPREEMPGQLRVNTLCHCSAGNYSAAGGSEATMFAGMSTGLLFLFPPPHLQGGGGRKEYSLHAGPCTLLCLSADGKTLITGGDDGAIFILNVTGVAGDEGGERAVPAGEASAATASSEIVLINRGEIQHRQDEYQALHAENLMLQARLAEEASKLEAEIASRVREARQRDEAEIQELTRRCNALRQATAAKERESARVRECMERTHKEAAEQLQQLYETKLEHEAERFHELLEEQHQLEVFIEELQVQTEHQLREERTKAEEERVMVLAEKDLEVQKHKDLIAFARHLFDEMLEEGNNANESEIETMKLENYKRLQERKRVEADLRKEQDRLLLGLDLSEKSKARIEKAQQEASLHIASLRSQCEELQRTVQSLNREKRERESTLEDKNQKLNEYKAKVGTLTKFKHVLNRDLREVTEAREPKDAMIAQRKMHLSELEAEFEKHLVEQRAAEEVIDQKKQHISFLTGEANRLHEKIKERDRVIDRFANDLHALVNNNSLDIRLWPQEIRRIYHSHVCGEKGRQDRMPVEEFQRQMRLMERKVTSLTVKGRQKEATLKADIQRKAQENSQLVSELNTIRMDNRKLTSQLKSLRAQLDQLESKLAEEQGAIPRSPAALEDAPMLPGAATSPAPVAPPRPPGGVGLPRVPSGGSLPGPRQRSQSPSPTTTTAMGEFMQSGASAAFQRPPRGVGGVAATTVASGLSSSRPPATGAAAATIAAAAAAAASPHLTEQEQKRLQNLLLTVDSNSQQLKVQKAENSQLRGQLEVLLRERRARGLPLAAMRASSGSPGPGGGGTGRAGAASIQTTSPLTSGRAASSASSGGGAMSGRHQAS